MDNPGQLLLLLFLVGCVLPLVGLVVLTVLLIWFGRKQLEHLASPDISSLMQEYSQSITRSPQSRDEIIQKIIRRQSFRCAVVGFFTGLGGFFTLPLALPIDVLLSVRLQATIVKFIASVYGFENSYDSRLAAYMIMSGSGELTGMSVRFLVRVIARLMGESLSRFVPFLGALISALVNYLLARSTGQMAAAWYSRRSQQVSLA